MRDLWESKGHKIHPQMARWTKKGLMTTILFIMIFFISVPEGQYSIIQFLSLVGYALLSLNLIDRADEKHQLKLITGLKNE